MTGSFRNDNWQLNPASWPGSIAFGDLHRLPGPTTSEARSILLAYLNDNDPEIQ